MHIAIIGYGKMGKMIEQIAIQRHHNIAIKLSSKDHWNADILKKSNADVAIEFTAPHAAVENIKKCFDANIPVVVGTTGWYQHLEEIQQICLSKNQSLLYASNFSIGVNLFLQINEIVANILSKHTNYNVQLLETHHTQKKDAPSGTAITIAEQILKYYPEKKQWSLSKNNSALFIQANRCDDEKGYHAVCYQSDIDAIEISHHAYSRKGFALGAVIAAEFLQYKKGIFTMKDVLNI